MSGHRAGGDDPGLSHLVACGVGREWGGAQPWGGGGGTYLVLGTHCKTDLRGCGLHCGRTNKRGGLLCGGSSLWLI